MSELDNYTYLYNQRINSTNKLKVKTILLPRGTLLFSGIDAVRSKDSITLYNDFMDIYTRGTFKKHHNGVYGGCHYGTFNKYTNYGFFHPCPFFPQNVNGFAHNFRAQGCFVLKSDIRLLVLMGNETKEEIATILKETKERYTRFRMRSFAQNDPSKINKGFIINTPDNLRASDNNIVRQGSDPMIDPEIVYDFEINGYITNATMDSNIIYNKPTNKKPYIKKEVGLYSLTGNEGYSNYTPKFQNEEEFLYQKKYLNMFSTFTEGTPPDSPNRSEISFGIPEIVLMHGSLKYMKEVIKKPKSLVDRDSLGLWKYQKTLNNPFVRFGGTHGSYYKKTANTPGLAEKVDNFIKHLKRNTDGEELCSDEINLFPEDDLQIKDYVEKPIYYGDNSITKFNIFTQLDYFNRQHDMQIMAPLFCAGCPSFGSGLDKCDQFYLSINKVMKQFLSALTQTDQIRYDNCTGFIVLKDIFHSFHPDSGQLNQQPFSSGKGTRLFIKDRDAYQQKWFSKYRTLKSNDKQENSDNTFWVLHPKWSSKNKGNIYTKLENYYHYNVNWYKNYMHNIKPYINQKYHLVPDYNNFNIYFKKTGPISSLLASVVFNDIQNGSFQFAYQTSDTNYSNEVLKIGNMPKMEKSLYIGNKEYSNLWGTEIPSPNQKTSQVSNFFYKAKKKMFPQTKHNSKQMNSLQKENNFFRMTTIILSVIVLLYTLYICGAFSIIYSGILSFLGMGMRLSENIFAAILQILTNIGGGILGGITYIGSVLYYILLHPSVFYPGIISCAYATGSFKTEYENLLEMNTIQKSKGGLFSNNSNKNTNPVGIANTMLNSKCNKTVFRLIRDGEYKLAVGKTAYSVFNLVNSILPQKSYGGALTQTMTMTETREQKLDDIDDIMRFENENSLVWIIDRDNLIIVIESFKDIEEVSITTYQPLFSEEFSVQTSDLLRQLWENSGVELSNYIDESTYFETFSKENIDEFISNSTFEFGNETEEPEPILDSEIVLEEGEDVVLTYQKTEHEINEEIDIEQQDNSIHIDDLTKVKNLFLGSLSEEYQQLKDGISDVENAKLANKCLTSYLTSLKAFRDGTKSKTEEEASRLFNQHGHIKSNSVLNSKRLSRKLRGNRLANAANRRRRSTELSPKAISVIQNTANMPRGNVAQAANRRSKLAQAANRRRRSIGTQNLSNEFFTPTLSRSLSALSPSSNNEFFTPEQGGGGYKKKSKKLKKPKKMKKSKKLKNNRKRNK